MFTLNGCGTRLYGNEWQNEETYIATKWIVIVFVPIIPLGSYLILDEDHGLISSKYQMIKIPLNWKQVGKTYLFTISVVLLIYLIIYFFL